MSFKGTVSSDFMRILKESDIKKSSLINFAGSDFNTLRANLVSYIKAVYPTDYNNFVSSDLGGMLIDLVAYVGAVTSMKADFLANENYLRTAKNRNSIKKLLELIGVRLKGPTAAVANARLTFDNDPFASNPEGSLTIRAQNRVVTISSPEDGQQVSYTLYKTANGQIQYSNSDATIELSKVESDGGAGLSFSNLVLIEGALISKTGTFLNSGGVKFVQLENSPVIEGSVEVFINGDEETSGQYTQVDNLYYVSGAGSKVFQLLPDDEFKATVAFGDDVLSMSPNPGDSYSITYRVGGGTRGNLAKEFINAPITVVGPNLANVNGTLENVTQATGGANAETIEQAKKYAPLAFRRQDRLVTLKDYQSFFNSFRASYGVVGKSVAVVRRAFSSANIIDIYTLEKANDLQLKKASPAFKHEMIKAAESKKMITDDLVIVDGLIRTLDLVVTLRVSRELLEDEEVIKQTVSEIIKNYFNVDNRDFGERFVPQDLAREIFELPEVVFATIDNYEGTVFVDFNEFIQLNNYTINIVRV